MARMDVEEYRRQYLKVVEERILSKKDSIPHYTSSLLHDAIMKELNRANEETWEIDVADDKEKALKEAEERIIKTMEENVDLGTGKSW
jgi:heme oxygenase